MRQPPESHVHAVVTCYLCNRSRIKHVNPATVANYDVVICDNCDPVSLGDKLGLVAYGEIDGWHGVEFKRRQRLHK